MKRLALEEVPEDGLQKVDVYVRYTDEADAFDDALAVRGWVLGEIRIPERTSQGIVERRIPIAFSIPEKAREVDFKV